MTGRALCFFLTFASIFTTAVRTATTCYGVNGLAYADQVICPGSRACCGVNATCLDNRLCHNPGDPQDTFVRGPCADDHYDESKCASICVYSMDLPFAILVFLGARRGWLLSLFQLTDFL